MLASNADVAESLGLAEDHLTQAQTLRLPLILAKLCGDFRYISGCELTPGLTTVKLLSVDGRITLPDKLDGVTENLDNQGNVISTVPNPGMVIKVQQWEDGEEIPFAVVGQDVLPRATSTFSGPRRVGTGEAFVVTYQHNGEVPKDVVAAIAAAAGKYLTVDPKSAVAQSTMLTAEGYHQRMAKWVADSVTLDDNLTQLAERYRSMPSMPIVQKLGRNPWPTYGDSHFMVGGRWMD